ncbi:hypothetical protein GCM10010112_90460 [Actinoplanes lobatus]|uniref:DUF3349 domain-containing protein n=1 Tax=Actinoplanes lobatus TaxID=113568 RepID=A0A7W7HKX8_9ACTN|nr:DUF3349 domain-containing protein [Actinoplanes lobatus]MBB4752451.1 hypothetical protein [Actinoplanes lobatus]GGN97825.1 hypothetical protein GCM10010112_90460 [Actinoplanes lobatus]GIE45804.1 hypothetical protein Alo02nite_87020 [Actinoplanes lobatus]
MSDQRSSFLRRAVGWLRAGYPTGVPRQDYVVLLGLLQRKLTEDEVRAIARSLADESVPNGEPVSADDIEQMIKTAVLQPALPEDVVRVSAHLAAGGWPLADPPLD